MGSAQYTGMRKGMAVTGAIKPSPLYKSDDQKPKVGSRREGGRELKTQ
jgi:hypothetical protein